MDNSKGLIGLLAVIAVVIAVVVIVGMGSTRSWFSGMATNGGETGVGAPAPQNQGTGGTATTVELTGLSATEKKIITPPSSTAPATEHEAYADFVNENAADTTSITIGAGCKISPIAIRIKTGATITVKNTDTVSHSLGFDSSNSVTIPAGESKQVATTFFNKTGIHGYGCDNIAGAAGMMVVVK